MKIAVISDVHSNYYVLQDVVKEIQKYKVDLKVCLGDMLGYYDSPNEVINLLRNNDFICIKGNHEKMILGEINYKLENKKIYGVERHRNELSTENIKFIKGLRDFYEINYKNLKVCFAHALKNNCEKYFFTEEDVLEHIHEIEKYDYYICGHTHRKKKWKIRDIFFVNPGAVGQPRDGWEPSFAIVDLHNNTVEIKTVQYDVLSYTNILNLKKYDSRLIEILRRNYDKKE